MPEALVRRPSPRLAEGLVTHIERQPVDHALAEQQWLGYVSALAASGWKPIDVPPADDCPDSVFVEDTVVMFGSLAVITRPGAPSRRPEIEAMPDVLAGLEIETAYIDAPGTLDGGDVLKVGTDVYVGQGGRTNADGIRQLRQLVRPRGLTVVAVPVTKVLHLKSAVTALPDGTVVGFDPLVDDTRLFPRYRSMPEESGAHVVVLDEDRVLMAADCPRSAALVASLGYDVVPVGIGEFQKLEGCVTCLSVRLRDR
ncbi:MAG TPA: arginine deiminase family protein [Mycobacteriales bacterium]|nr:arginine deiminase family protein [Mycobacteriales bacterium]